MQQAVYKTMEACQSGAQGAYNLAGNFNCSRVGDGTRLTSLCVFCVFSVPCRVFLTGRRRAQAKAALFFVWVLAPRTSQL